MVSFKLAAAVASICATLSSAQTINTPTALYTCQPYAVTWSGGTAPYYVRVYQGGSNSVVLETLQSSVSTTTYTWTVDQAAGTSVTLGVTDSLGVSAYAAEVTVADGGSTTCLTASSGSSTVASASSAASSAATSASSAASSASSTAAGAVSSVASKASSAAASATSKAASAASSAAAAATSAAGTSGASPLKIGGSLLAGAAAVGAFLA